jgi:hypothetical protein
MEHMEGASFLLQGKAIPARLRDKTFLLGIMMNLTLILLHVAMSVESKSSHRFSKARKVVRALVLGDAPVMACNTRFELDDDA